MFDTNGFYEFKTDIFKILNGRELNIFFLSSSIGIENCFFFFWNQITRRNIIIYRGTIFGKIAAYRCRLNRRRTNFHPYASSTMMYSRLRYRQVGWLCCLRTWRRPVQLDLTCLSTNIRWPAGTRPEKTRTALPTVWNCRNPCSSSSNGRLDIFAFSRDIPEEKERTEWKSNGKIDDGR